MKDILTVLTEIDGLMKEFQRKKAEHVAALSGAGTSPEAIENIESERQEIQNNIYARDPYTNPRRFINWN